MHGNQIYNFRIKPIRLELHQSLNQMPNWDDPWNCMTTIYWVKWLKQTKNETNC